MLSPRHELIGDKTEYTEVALMVMWDAAVYELHSSNINVDDVDNGDIMIMLMVMTII